ncbi:cyclophilin-like fold protein [Oscillospiraceae bacterium 44-5]
MKHLKKTLSLALAVLLALGISVPAFAAVEDTGFSDVDANAWYADAVIYCRENGLMAGTSTTTFAPESPLTRAMLAAVLYRMAGSPSVTGQDSFTDTEEGSWYSDSILWASRQGLVAGYGNGLFGINDPVSVEQLEVIMGRYTGDGPEWTGNPAKAHAATRAEVAAAIYASLAVKTDEARILVAYFSRYGNTNYDSNVDATTSASVVIEDGQRQGTTELIARMIAEQTGGDLHLIETADAYPKDFNDVVSQNHQEIANGVRPALSSSVDLTGYDVIFVGYPVWASNTPTPVLSFLESQSLSGKTVIPFCTHDGYGAGSSYSSIRSSSNGATVEQGLAIEATDAASSERTVTNWLNGLNLPSLGTGNTTQQPQGETAIRITIGDTQLDGVLYDSSMARQFIAQLPQTITMSNYGGREVYGGIDQAITVEGEGQLRFDDGDITYCSSNNTAAIFYSQSSRPNLTMTVYPIGKVTSDLSIFPDLPSRVEITFEVIS